MSTSSAFPHPDGMKSFWQKNPGHLDNHRSTEELPRETDLVVIGAGYSGGSFLTHLLAKESAKGLSILVLEARQLCSGATGRNGGHMKPDPYFKASEIADEYGTKAGIEVANFEMANMAAVKDFVEREKIDCDMMVTRAVDVQLTQSMSRKVKACLDKFADVNAPTTRETFYFEGDKAEMISGVKGAKSCINFTAGHLWPYKLVHHMFISALAKGVNLQTNTRVEQVSASTDDLGRWTISTRHGIVKAKKVVVATNAYTPAILPEYKDKIIPYRGICSRIVTPGPAPLLVNTYALRFRDWDFDYLIPRSDGSIVVGGARSAYFKEFEEWYDNTDDSMLVNSAKTYFDGYMQRHFRGWENSGAYVSDIWTGIQAYSSDKLPHIGLVPEKPGMFIMSGFNGHGMPQIFLCAKGLADMVADGASFRSTGLPTVFEESKARLLNPRNRVRETYDVAFNGVKL